MNSVEGTKQILTMEEEDDELERLALQLGQVSSSSYLNIGEVQNKEGQGY
jgi:hypothetical protein